MGNANRSLSSTTSDVVSRTQSIEDQLCLPCDGEQLQTLREKQERLILLRHCYYCTGSNCEKPHCAEMKSLLTHMKTCTEGHKCTMKHCASSRIIIHHFHDCKDRQCIFCAPVRRSSKQGRKQRTGRAVRNITTIGRNNIMVRHRNRLTTRGPDISAH
mmetsp:Transcript_4228/g.4829  ORF Transcript_4228/g.4829 Transcript_4228/m.4829 type:complete len:158 (-) Transcript_4228:225-698(-)